MTTNLKPCPFCGSSAFRPEGYTTLICCTSDICSVVGPLDPDPEASVAAWNYRPMDRDWFTDVRDFAKKFGQPTPSSPRVLSTKEFSLRIALIGEETGELLDAHANKDLPDFADAIGDLAYVVIGTAVASGIDLRPVWDAIHAANMVKTGGSTREDGKIMKPDGWKPPDIEGALKKGDPTR